MNDVVLVQIVAPRELLGEWIPAAAIRLVDAGDVHELELLPQEDAVKDLERRLKNEERTVAKLRADLERAQTGGESGDDAEDLKTASRLFDHWRESCHHGNAQVLFTDDRKRKVRARLRESPDAAALIVKAIDAVAAYPFVVDGGRSSTGTTRQRFDDLELICRTRANVERFAALAPGVQVRDVEAKLIGG